MLRLNDIRLHVIQLCVGTLRFKLKKMLFNFQTGKSVGLDLGLNDMVVTSDNFKSGRFIEKSLEKRIRLQQRKYSKRRNRAKLIIKESSDSLRIHDLKMLKKLV